MARQFAYSVKLCLAIGSQQVAISGCYIWFNGLLVLVGISNSISV
jgi:hypothetical protein